MKKVVKNVKIVSKDVCKKMYIDMFKNEYVKEQAAIDFDENLFPEVIFGNVCKAVECDARWDAGWYQLKTSNGVRARIPECFIEKIF